MECQRLQFSLPDDEIYLNCARKAPQSKRLEEIGLAAIRKQSQPNSIMRSEFFQPVDTIKKEFAKLVSVDDPDRIAIIPSVSYGLANVANNLQLATGDKVLVVAEQFPSNIYPWLRVIEEAGAKLEVIEPPSQKNRGANWNELILESIDDQTKMVAIGNVHWADGTLFNLAAIRKKTLQHQALLVIDGTQSVGALPFSVAELQPDALIVAGYKWLMGPYSIGVAYYGPAFDNGRPVEENWINRKDSDDFAQLINYKIEYRPKAARYSMGEQSNFILCPLLLGALQQLNEWNPSHIQDYCKKITASAIESWTELGLDIESENHRAHHLFGIRLTDDFDSVRLKELLEQHRIAVSFRGTAIRVSPNVYNYVEEVATLGHCFEKARRQMVY